MNIKRIRTLFDKFATEYDRHMLETNHIVTQHKILGNLISFFRGSVLDIATGTGIVAKYIQSKSMCKVHAVDNSPEMIKQAKKDSQGVEYKVADAHRLPYDNETFNGITVCYGFYWFDNPEKVINEIRRVLKADGIFIVMEEEFKEGQTPKPIFFERRKYLKELADLENYIGIDNLKQEIERQEFDLIRETRVSVDEVHDTIGMVYRKKATLK